MEHPVGRLAFRHLRLLVAIVEEGNLVGAARRQNLTQPAVTKAVKEAEAILGIPLFDRTNRGVRPTTYCTALVSHARLVIAQLGHAGEEISDLRDGSGGRIAVGTLLAASAALLPQAIALLRKSRPKLVVSVREGTNDLLMPALRVGELDLVVGRLPEFREREALVQETLLSDIACVVVRPGHPLTERDPLRLADLVAWDWILPRYETTLRRQIDKTFRDEQLEPPTHAVESVSLLTNRGLLFDADYLAVWPWQVARVEEEAGRIAILRLKLGPTAGPIGITTRAGGRLSPAADMLVRELRSVARGLSVCPFLD